MAAQSAPIGSGSDNVQDIFLGYKNILETETEALSFLCRSYNPYQVDVPCAQEIDRIRDRIIQIECISEREEIRVNRLRGVGLTLKGVYDVHLPPEKLNSLFKRCKIEFPLHAATIRGIWMYGHRIKEYGSFLRTAEKQLSDTFIRIKKIDHDVQADSHVFACQLHLIFNCFQWLKDNIAELQPRTRDTHKFLEWQELAPQAFQEAYFDQFKGIDEIYSYAQRKMQTLVTQHMPDHSRSSNLG